MSTTIVFVLVVWLALNVAFVALRLYVSSNPISRSRRSICLGRVSQCDAVHRLAGLEEPQSRLL
jgi:hypothetical protein